MSDVCTKAKRKEAEFRKLCDGFRKLAEYPEEYDVEYAIHAQAEVIAAANERNLAMIFTARRHFRH